MDRFQQRQARIIKTIADANSRVTGKSLSAAVGCSLRTAQSEIREIDRLLPGLIISDNKGYRVDRELYGTLKQDILKPDRDYSHIILRKLLFDEKLWQVDELAESLYMSTAALESRLKKLSVLLRKYHLELSRKKAHISIEGAESDKRELIRAMILQETTANFNDISSLGNYFADINIEKIRSIIVNAIRRYDCYIEDIYVSNITVNIAIALYRMREDNYISPEYVHSMDRASVEYRISEEICRQYANHWGITPSTFDLSYIAALLMGQIKPLTACGTSSLPEGVISGAFIEEVRAILQEVFSAYALNVDFSDILYNFALHVDGIIKRAGHSPAINNELLDNVKRNCPFVYDISVYIAQKVMERFDTPVSDTEIGYISVHIGFLIEQSIESTEKVYVLLLSNDYHHISDSIQAKLLDNFSDLIELQVLRSADSGILLQTRADLILSTKALELVGKKILTISPFYTMKDYAAVDQAIHECLAEKKRRSRNQLLSPFFREDLFFLRDNFQDKEEVIRFLSQKLIDCGIAEKGFTASVLKRESLSSTCFFDTFAIPHAMELNAKQTMNCILVSRNGIPWDEHRVYIVMLIAVQQEDRKEFMKLYNGIVQSLENPEIVSQIRQVSDFREFMKIIKCC